MVNLLQRAEDHRILVGFCEVATCIHQWSETCGDKSLCRTTANDMTFAEPFVCAITCSGTNSYPLQATRSLSAIQVLSM